MKLQFFECQGHIYDKNFFKCQDFKVKPWGQGHIYALWSSS